MTSPCLPYEIQEFERLLYKPNSDPTGLASLFASGEIWATRVPARLDVGNRSLTLTFSQESGLDIEGMIQFVSNKSDKFQFLPQNKLRISMQSILPVKDLDKVEEAIKALGVFKGKNRWDKI